MNLCSSWQELTTEMESQIRIAADNNRMVPIYYFILRNSKFLTNFWQLLKWVWFATTHTTLRSCRASLSWSDNVSWNSCNLPTISLRSVSQSEFDHSFWGNDLKFMWPWVGFVEAIREFWLAWSNSTNLYVWSETGLSYALRTVGFS